MCFNIVYYIIYFFSLQDKESKTLMKNSENNMEGIVLASDNKTHNCKFKYHYTQPNVITKLVVACSLSGRKDKQLFAKVSLIWIVKERTRTKKCTCMLTHAKSIKLQICT